MVLDVTDFLKNVGLTGIVSFSSARVNRRSAEKDPFEQSGEIVTVSIQVLQSTLVAKNAVSEGLHRWQYIRDYILAQPFERDGRYRRDVP